MAKSVYEKAMDKHNKEAKKLAEQEARRQRASAIVNGQALIGGMRIMDAAAEELLAVLLDIYDGNEEKHVQGTMTVFRRHIIIHCCWSLRSSVCMV